MNVEYLLEISLLWQGEKTPSQNQLLLVQMRNGAVRPDSMEQ